MQLSGMVNHPRHNWINYAMRWVAWAVVIGFGYTVIATASPSNALVLGIVVGPVLVGLLFREMALMIEDGPRGAVDDEVVTESESERTPVGE